MLTYQYLASKQFTRLWRSSTATLGSLSKDTGCWWCSDPSPEHWCSKAALDPGVLMATLLLSRAVARRRYSCPGLSSMTNTVAGRAMG